MACVHQMYTEHVYYGARRISQELKRQGLHVGRKRARTYMGIMGINALYPKPRMSISNKEHKKYPYLLKGIEVAHPNKVWRTDIAYIKTPGGFVYLMAIIDWYSRYIVTRDIGTSMDSYFCNSVLKKL